MDCCSLGSSVHGDSPGKNTGVGCHSLLQGIFPTQGLNPGLLELQMDSVAQLAKNPPAMQETPIRFLGWEGLLEKGKATHSRFWPGEFHELYRVAKSQTWLSYFHFTSLLYHLSHEGSPRILEWVAYPFSRGTSQSRSRTALQADLQDQMPSLAFGPSFLRAWEVQIAKLWSK